MQEVWISIRTFNTLDDLTVRAAMDYVAQTFLDNGKGVPWYDKDVNLSQLLQIQYKVY